MPELLSSYATLGLVGLGAYLLGSVPFGMLMARIFGLGDLRGIGSGNIGATNVLRTGNKPAAFLTLVLDAGKGAAAVLIARAAIGAGDAAQIAGLMSFLGHLFPVYLGFRGGKGVATYLGTLLALWFPAGAAACLLWLASALIFRISSLSALIAALVAPLVPVFAGRADLFGLTAFFAGLIVIKHRANVMRLWHGQEPKIGRKG